MGSWGGAVLKPAGSATKAAPLLCFTGGLRGASIIDSLDTLYIMGLTEEYNDAKEWVQNSLEMNTPRKSRKYHRLTRAYPPGHCRRASGGTHGGLVRTCCSLAGREELDENNRMSGTYR
ncbi:hypothetical protein NHX12_001698 [Muraenolepis orangiensis]|uniref:Alpha-1,2-Mannosidase n=1 Tax=Muraenolepis orangiensis TaxID=630683 RepID=A0A9Q0E526_9TELE|nr:hypothetical protein NHX12_001698 [Muraenolepis orangiensis]